jgi:hypothetical protein
MKKLADHAICADHLTSYSVRNLGIFMSNLIQKIQSKLVTICICTCVILLLALVDMNMNNMLTIAEKILNLTNSRKGLYPEEGPILMALMAPFTRDIVCYSK